MAHYNLNFVILLVSIIIVSIVLIIVLVALLCGRKSLKYEKQENEYTPNILKKINHQLKKLKLLEYTKDEVRCLKKFLVFLNKMEYQDLPQYIKMLNSDHKHEKHFKGKNEKLIFNQLFQLFTIRHLCIQISL